MSTGGWRAPQPPLSNLMQIFRNSYHINDCDLSVDYVIQLPASGHPFVVYNADQRVVDALRWHLHEWLSAYRTRLGYDPDVEEELASATGLADRLRRLHGFASPLMEATIRGRMSTERDLEADRRRAYEREMANARAREMRMVEAMHRSEETLRRHLTRDQWASYRAWNYFDVVSQFGNSYRLIKKGTGNIYRPRDKMSFCVVFENGDIPLPDLLLAQKLLLESAEDFFLRTAQSNPFAAAIAQIANHTFDAEPAFRLRGGQAVGGGGAGGQAGIGGGGGAGGYGIGITGIGGVAGRDPNRGPFDLST